MGVQRVGREYIVYVIEKVNENENEIGAQQRMLLRQQRLNIFRPVALSLVFLLLFFIVLRLRLFTFRGSTRR